MEQMTEDDKAKAERRRRIARELLPACINAVDIGSSGPEREAYLRKGAEVAVDKAFITADAFIARAKAEGETTW